MAPPCAGNDFATVVRKRGISDNKVLSASSTRLRRTFVRKVTINVFDRRNRRAFSSCACDADRSVADLNAKG
jgi:hypothetical protein